MFELLNSIEQHNEIPPTFDGELPHQAFGENPLPRLQIGQVYLVPGPDGIEVPATLTQATVMDGKAHCAMHDPRTDKAWIGTFEMTPEELADYKRYPDTYFGVYQKQTRRAETAMDLFDFFVEGYRNTPKERLIELLPNYPDQERLRALSQKELVEILAERYTYGAIQQGFQPKVPSGRRRGRPVPTKES